MRKAATLLVSWLPCCIFACSIEITPNVSSKTYQRIMRFGSSVMLALLIAGNNLAGLSFYKATPVQRPATSLTGRWQIKFNLTGDAEKHLILDSLPSGKATFQLLDTGPDNKPVSALQPGAWAMLTNNRISFSLETELPLGTCCRELGTLMFKGKFVSSDSISGRLLFVTSVDEEESPYKFHSTIGAFTANRIGTRTR